MHQGMTSSDVLDTCLAVQLARASDILIADLDALLEVLKRRAYRAQADADDRPQPRHPCRARHLRAEARPGLCRVRSQPRAAGRGARGDRHLRDLRRGRHLRQYRSVRRSACRGEDGAERRAGLDPGDPARPPRDVLRDARRDRLVDRAARDRDPPSAAHRSAGGGGIFLARPEGLVGDAAQAQPGADRESDRPRPHGARLCDAGAGECRAVARARHQPFVGRALYRPRRDDHARFRARPADRRDGQAASSIPSGCRRTSTDGRPRPFAARAAGADPGRASAARTPIGWSSATR